MKITIEINTENAAFEDDPCGEVARILRYVVNEMLERGRLKPCTLLDTNGNTCGSVKTEE